MAFQKITIIGVGLLGGSLGLAVRRRRMAGEIAGFVRRKASIAECEKSGATDFATMDLAAAVSNADLVIFCTPPGRMRPIAQQFAGALKPGAIVTDVGSVKAPVVKELEPLLARAGAHFVGSHPMAGGEKTGIAAAREDLFENAVCALTPTSRTNAAALKKTAEFWKSLGSRVLKMSPARHDLFVSRSSHLPHLAAAALANVVLNSKQPEIQLLCGNGFRDTTRIASGSSEMWRDIALANRKNLAYAAAALIAELEKFRTMLKKADAPAIAEFFETAKSRRDRFINSRRGCSESANPD
ncbi:MAG: prephenate dehydrogenase/arogenate dehydrogenase family protein [Verrucomicrobia bacterium]|nr:prephenate dehydrogenase/arogenate dehydrogenase family protein [Verrucomicrobiota bacterium]MDE3098973.1 prephenate dehydrogenase/arogenate dehydrogenase family protein [Verrucomicrobiota bacterium]